MSDPDTSSVRMALSAASTPADGLSQAEICQRTGLSSWVVNDALCRLRSEVGNHRVSSGRKRATKYYLKDKPVVYT